MDCSGMVKDQGIAENCLAVGGRVTHDLYLDRFPAVPGGFRNLTNIDVPVAVQTLLSYGPKFTVPTVPTFKDYVTQFFTTDSAAVRAGQNVQWLLRGFMLKSCDWMLTSFENKLSPVDRRLTLMYKQTKQFLVENPHLCLIQGDKSKSTVLMRVQDYDEKMKALLNTYVSRGMYVLVSDMAEVRNSKRFWYEQYSILKTALVAEWQSAQEKPFPYPLLVLLNQTDKEDVALPYLYGVVKDHKPEAPCRPICSVRGWYSWALQKVTTHILTHVTQDLLCKMNVKNISHVAHGIRALQMRSGYVFAKLDVHEMYPTMDRFEILNVISRLIHSPAYKARGLLSPELFMKIFELCMDSHLLFCYNDQVYRQVKGLPQGAPDSGLLACIYLDHILQSYHHNIFVKRRVVLWYKYVDDILFYLPETEQECLVAVLQNHTGLKFTIEREEPCRMVVDGRKAISKISFLDLEIIQTGQRCYTRVFRKPMASSRTCHYLSHAPLIWKENTLKNSFVKVLDRVSNPFVLEDLRTMEYDFLCNMYPVVLIAKTMEEAVRAHLRACEALHSMPQPNSHLNSLGCFHERRQILAVYLHVNVGKKGPLKKRFKLDVGRVFTPRKYSRSVPYVCCEISEVLSEWHRILELPLLTHRNSKTLFQKLRMHKRSVDPSGISDVGVGREAVALLTCPHCNICFLVQCPEGIFGSALKTQLKINSSVSRHEAQTGHMGTLNQVPMMLDFSLPGQATAGQRIALMQAIYVALGYECRTEGEIELLPLIVRRGLEIYLRDIGSPLDEFKLIGECVCWLYFVFI